MQHVVRGTIENYIPEKFFGFVNLDSGRKAFLHGSVVRKYCERQRLAAETTPLPGDIVEGKTTFDEKGRERFSVLTRIGNTAQEYCGIGVVKFYDPQKGYGFISSSELSDVFLHHSVLRKAGIDGNSVEGETVSFDYEHGERGLKATTVALA